MSPGRYPCKKGLHSEGYLRRPFWDGDLNLFLVRSLSVNTPHCWKPYLWDDIWGTRFMILDGIILYLIYILCYTNIIFRICVYIFTYIYIHIYLFIYIIYIWYFVSFFMIYFGIPPECWLGLVFLLFSDQRGLKHVRSIARTCLPCWWGQRPAKKGILQSHMLLQPTEMQDNRHKRYVYINLKCVCIFNLCVYRYR